MLRGEGPGSVFDEDYWLSHCQGFQARTAERGLGVISEVRFLSRLDRPDQLVVCSACSGTARRSCPWTKSARSCPAKDGSTCARLHKPRRTGSPGCGSGAP